MAPKTKSSETVASSKKSPTKKPASVNGSTASPATPTKTNSSGKSSAANTTGPASANGNAPTKAATAGGAKAPPNKTAAGPGKANPRASTPADSGKAARKSTAASSAKPKPKASVPAGNEKAAGKATAASPAKPKPPASTPANSAKAAGKATAASPAKSQASPPVSNSGGPSSPAPNPKAASKATGLGGFLSQVFSIFIASNTSPAVTPAVTPAPKKAASATSNPTLRTPQYDFFFPLTAPCEASLQRRGPLKPEGFGYWLRNHPDAGYRNTLMDIITFGAKIGYTGPDQHSIHQNFSSASKVPGQILADIAKRIELGQFHEYPPGELPKKFISSPLGLSPKHDGTWRRIHNLSYPSKPPKTSVNDCIPQEWGSLQYTKIDEAMKAIQRVGPRAYLIKRDLADAFRHVPVHPDDWWLLGFSWHGRFWSDQFLPFGLRTSPIIFDKFSSALEWILKNETQWKETLHYLDDFLGVFPAGQKVDSAIQDFNRVCKELGFKVKDTKNEEGTRVTFLGIELDTVAMEARLPRDKHHKAIAEVKDILEQSVVPYSKLQALVGRLSFVCGVIPAGRPYIRRLHDEMMRSSEGQSISISDEARKDLRWWSTFLPGWNGITILRPPAQTFNVWTSASTEGIGGHFLRGGQKEAEHSDWSQLFSAQVPDCHKEQFAGFRELFSVLHAINIWNKILRDSSVVVHCEDRETVKTLNTITKRAVRGPSIEPLRSIAMLVATHHITLTACNATPVQNKLAKALSRAELSTVAVLCPKLGKRKS